MDKGTLKNKLKTFFTYYFLKVTAICVVICLVFTFAYYIVEKKPTEGQRFAILYADDVVLGEEVDSIIINAIEGPHGFGYDPIFIPEGYNEPFSLISDEVKNDISHRGVATKLLMKYLDEYLK